jgi:Domain of unknown function (DUF3859)
MWRRLVGVVVLAVYCTTGIAEPTDVWSDPGQVRDIKAGIFCTPPASSRSRAAGTIKGTVERFDETPVLAQETLRVPAIEGITFGVQGREARNFNGVVTITVTHPPLGPKGATRESWTTHMEPDRITMHAYFLGLSDGNPVGRWTVEARRGAKRLFHAGFDVVPAGKAREPCRGRQLS